MCLASTCISPSEPDLGKAGSHQGGAQKSENVLLRRACPQQAARAACGIWQLSLNLNQNEEAWVHIRPSVNVLKWLRDQMPLFACLRNGSGHLVSRRPNPELWQCSVYFKDQMHICKKRYLLLTWLCFCFVCFVFVFFICLYGIITRKITPKIICFKTPVYVSLLFPAIPFCLKFPRPRNC